MRRWRDAGSQGKRKRKRSRRSQKRGHEGPVSRKATKSQSGGKPRKVRNRVRGGKERVGKTSDEYHHMVSHKTTFGGRAIHSQSELEKMIKIG